ncbi:class-10 pathogenesis-related protein 1-like [Neltuma alba]|uniref:class-10 pathogenesis-related protein 1-like n=1 Tax=Neltuma alba TaxID=207710 RepID=UPI0010A532E1|nr:class-10 pathogenesis-related protein 1-like [Prosopis alba]
MNHITLLAKQNQYIVATPPILHCHLISFSQHSKIFIIMGVFTFSEENISAVAPATLYKALVFDGDNLVPKVVDAVQSIEILQGTGAAGTIRRINYLEDGKLHYAKHKVEAVDKDNFVYNYALVESDIFPETLEKIAVETKLAAAPNGGSVVKVTVNYVTKGDAKPSEEELKIGKQKGDGLFKAVEAYVLANPSYKLNYM